MGGGERVAFWGEIPHAPLYYLGRLDGSLSMVSSDIDIYALIAFGDSTGRSGAHRVPAQIQQIWAMYVTTRVPLLHLAGCQTAIVSYRPVANLAPTRQTSGADRTPQLEEEDLVPVHKTLLALERTALLDDG